MSLPDIIFAIGGAVIGLLIGLFVIGQRKFDESRVLERAKKLLGEAEAEAREFVKAAKEHATEMEKIFESEEKELIAQHDMMERAYAIKANSFQRRDLKVKELKRALQAEEQVVNGMRDDNKKLDEHIGQKLIAMTGSSTDEIKRELLNEYENSYKADAEARLQKITEWVEERSLKDSRAIIADAIYRYSAPTSVEHERNEIKVSHDEVKGRLIGRSGSNIAFFEELFQVDVIFNDEPNIIIVNCFNLVQQEVARQAMIRLMRERVINEEVIRNIKPLAEKDVDKILMREGENALKILNVKNMPSDFAKLVGRLKFRTSYGQNIMGHCFEVGYFACLLAGAVGANTETALLGGFFHDLGKAVDQEVGGSHDVLSKEILEKYGFSWEIVHSAWTHHNSAPQETVEARLVQAADAISAGRPGARAESLERYLAKIKDLQETTLSFAGVKKAFAINAGREVRAIVDPDKIDDANVEPLAKNIAAKVEEKGGYPGKIKVVTIRTTKVTDHAR